MKKEKSETELDWTAFLYVSDEMTTSEREAFETRLSEDQLAREAVAHAFVLGKSLHEGFVRSERNQVQSNRARSKGRTGTWVQLAAIAAIFFIGIVGVQWWQQPIQPSPEISRSLAVVWAEAVASEAVESDEFEYDSDEDETLIDIQSVGWMTVALSEMEAIDSGVEE